MTEKRHGQPILIVGAGHGGTALLQLFVEEVLVHVVGVVDVDADAPGMKFASDHDIPVFTDVQRALEQVGGCLVFNLTQDESVSELAAGYVGTSSVVGGDEAKLFWQLISRMQTAKEQLWENQLRMQAVIHNVREGIISINPRGMIESVNPATEQVFGYRPEELIGQNISKLMPEPDRSMHDTYLRNYLKTGKRHVIGHYREVTGLHKDGYEFPLEINIAEMDMDGVKHFVGLVRDISERKAAEARVTRLALYDQLTGLPNRTLLYETLKSALAQARRLKSLCALLFIDLDGFKAVNDTLGHEAGDALLKEVGSRLQGSVRESDMAARLGGDEFVVLLNNLHDQQAVASIADKLIEAINRPVTFKGEHCHVGASIGIALYPDHAEDDHALLKAADQAMYAAKDAGKNVFRIAEP